MTEAIRRGEQYESCKFDFPRDRVPPAERSGHSGPRAAWSGVVYRRHGHPRSRLDQYSS